MGRPMSAASIEARLEAKLLAMLLDDADIRASGADCRRFMDTTRPRSELAIVARAYQLQNENLDSTSGGTYYSVRLAAMVYSKIDDDRALIVFNKTLGYVNKVMQAFSPTPSLLDTTDVLCYWVEQAEPDELNEDTQMGRAPTIVAHVSAL